MKSEEILRIIEQSGVVAIIRTKKDLSAEIMDAMTHLQSSSAGGSQPANHSGAQPSGLRAIEITLNTPKALEMITWARSKLAPDTAIGAGTITSLEELKAAIGAGAQFIVTPVLDVAIITESLRADVPITPGCFTPTEALAAHRAGAPLIKVFPCSQPEYIRAMLAPLPQLNLMPTGGVDEKNCAEFIRAGAKAVGIGSGIFSEKLLAKRDFATIGYQAGLILKGVAFARENPK